MNIGGLFLITLSFHVTLLAQPFQDYFHKMNIRNVLYEKKSENVRFQDEQVKNDFQLTNKEEGKVLSSSVQDELRYSHENERRFDISKQRLSKLKPKDINMDKSFPSLSTDDQSIYRMENFDKDKLSESVVTSFSNEQYKYYVKDLNMLLLHSSNGSVTAITVTNAESSFKIENFNTYYLAPLLFPQTILPLYSKLKKYSRAPRRSIEEQYSRAPRRSIEERVKSKRKRNNISLWIDEQQVRMFSGYPMEIYVIVEGRVMPYILDPDFESQLPIIPSEVKTVNFTWKSGGKKYIYNFDKLKSFNANILHPPFVSIRRRGRVPKKSKSFSVQIPCVGNVSGVATFSIGLLIHNMKGDPLPDTPIHLRLRKKCEIIGDSDAACDEKCANGGICNAQKKCQCPEGYMGKRCETALCYPQCHNGGTCSSPGRCSCLEGYHGRYCEGGICSQKCLNGGKCVQKDTCACQNGYYGNRCEFSKCIIPCVNNGKCQGVNKCRCKAGFSGNHCEIITVRGLSQLFRRCRGKCRHGECVEHGKCKCNEGFSGRWCKTRISHKKHKHKRKKKLLV